MTDHTKTANADLLVGQFVSVPHPDGVGRMILRRRHAALLASGGTINPERGYIKGGDPTYTGMPDGAQPLSRKEAKWVREVVAMRGSKTDD